MDWTNLGEKSNDMVPMPQGEWKVYLSPALNAELEAFCELYGKTPREVLEEAIEAYIIEAPRKPLTNVTAASKRSIR